MTFHRGSGAPEPVGRLGAAHEERRVIRSSRLATATLACPLCDAPVAPPQRRMSPADPLGCPFCRHAGVVREFLSLATPTRPARVEVRVVHGRLRPRARSL